jgi:hypothetical protein
MTYVICNSLLTSSFRLLSIRRPPATDLKNFVSAVDLLPYQSPAFRHVKQTWYRHCIIKFRYRLILNISKKSCLYSTVKILKFMEFHICIIIFARSHIITQIIVIYYLFSRFVIYYNFNSCSIFPFKCKYLCFINGDFYIILFS